MKRIVIAAAIVVAAVACSRDTPTTPRNSDSRGSHLQPGHTANGFLNAPDTAGFYFDAQAGQLLAVYAASTDSTVLLWFADSGQPANNFFFVDHGQVPSKKPAFTYLVPQTGSFVLAFVRRAEANAQQSYYALRVDTVYMGPEHTDSTIAVNQIVSGESIDSVGDIDIFTFKGTAGKEIVGYVQAIAASTDGVTMSIYGDDPDSVLLQIASTGGDTALEYWASNPATLPTTGTYHVKLQATTGSYVGPYRFEVYQVDSAPESISANVTPGDTIQGESINHVEDLDVFTVNGKGGATYNLFAQYMSAPGNVLQFVARDASGNVLTALNIVPGSALTAGPGGGPFLAPASGKFTITVSGDGGILNRGPYRFFLYAPSSAPEIAPANFNVGDSVTTETIGLPGDTDKFFMHVPVATVASLCITASSAAATAGSPTVSVYGPAGNSVGAIGTAQATGSLCTGGFIAPAGVYSVVVADPAPWGSFRGLYKLNSYSFSLAPEHVPATITIGDTVTGESIDVPGDIDVFTFKTHRFTMLGVDVIGGSPNPVPNWSFTGALPGIGIFGGEGNYGRFDLDSNSHNTFEMSSASPSLTGPYKFVFYQWPTAPEHHSANVTLGDSITDESIDFSGDVDQFTVTGTPGGYGIISLQGAGVQAIVMPTDSTSATWTASYGYLQYSQRFQIPASGSVLLRVRQYMYTAQPITSGSTGSPIPYAVKTFAINPAPEHVPAATAIGDTVSGESIDEFGDLDQFTFSGTAGQKIVVEFATPQNVYEDATHIGGTLVLQVLAPDGTVLGQISSGNPTPLSAQTTGTLTLPSTGQYTISVSGANNGQGGFGAYVFAILPSS